MANGLEKLGEVQAAGKIETGLGGINMVTLHSYFLQQSPDHVYTVTAYSNNIIAILYAPYAFAATPTSLAINRRGSAANVSGLSVRVSGVHGFQARC